MTRTPSAASLRTSGRRARHARRALVALCPLGLVQAGCERAPVARADDAIQTTGPGFEPELWSLPRVAERYEANLEEAAAMERSPVVVPDSCDGLRDEAGKPLVVVIKNRRSKPIYLQRWDGCGGCNPVYSSRMS